MRITEDALKEAGLIDAAKQAKSEDRKTIRSMDIR